MVKFGSPRWGPLLSYSHCLLQRSRRRAEATVFGDVARWQADLVEIQPELPSVKVRTRRAHVRTL